MKPTLEELRYASLNGGQLPESYFKRTRQPKEKIPQKPRGTETIEPEIIEEWPKDTGSGWFQLSTGKKVRGEDKARAEQAKIDGE